MLAGVTRGRQLNLLLLRRTGWLLPSFVFGVVVFVAPPVEARVSVGLVSIVEGHSGTRVAKVPVALDAPSEHPVAFSWELVGSGAEAGEDFVAAAGHAVIRPRTVTRMISVAVLGDEVAEGDEAVTVRVTALVDGLEEAAEGSVTILDDEGDETVRASIGDVTVVEGDAMARRIVFPLTLSRPTPGASVTFRVVAGSASAGWSGSPWVPLGADIADRSGEPRTVRFEAGAVSKAISVPIAADLMPEGEESFSIQIDAAAGVAVGRSGTGTIVDDDPVGQGDARFGPSAELVGTVEDGSTLIGCDRADERITLTTSAHLDPSCVYTKGFRISASAVTLDCRGAEVVRRVEDSAKHGVQILAPTNVALHDVTVRNCHVSGFDNNVRISRDNFKDLAPGFEYDLATSRLLIENSTFADSVNTGIFIDAFVSGVRFSRNSVAGSGSVGVYLEAGSRDNVIENNRIVDNGWKTVRPGPATIEIGGATVEYISTGREGIAIDGSRDNVIRDNFIGSNAAGGIFAYKNCGEESSKQGHWVRRYGATGNRILRNVIEDGPNGVWIGSRAAENQLFMDCSDTPIVSNAASRVYLDPATDNVITSNRIRGVTNAIRVEGDRTVVRGNLIEDADRGILVGSRYLTTLLAKPIAETEITANVAVRANVPYAWVWGLGPTRFARNAADGARGGLVMGTPPAINPFLMVVRLLP